MGSRSAAGVGDGTPRAAAAGRHPAAWAAPGGDDLPDLPTPDEQARECQAMNLVTLREVFASRHNLSKKAARGAGLVFRGVSGQMRALEYGQRD